MRPLRNIAVIACDQGLLSSLVFSLEVAGFGVRAFTAWPPEGLVAEDIACIVVDADAYRRDQGLRAGLAALPVPLVYLADDLPPVPADPHMARIQKPFQGPDLLQLVEAQASGRTPPEAMSLLD